jgi:hypothetical protein
MYNSNNGHELILRENSYNLNKKILAIHSEDRDIGKWPYSNIFEIQCPQVYQNVESIRLTDITLPKTIPYTFVHNYQNTIFLFKVIPSITSSYYSLLNNDTIYNFEIQEGNYTGEQLALEIQNNLNNTITNALSSIPYTYTNFKVYYDLVANKLHYGNQIDAFQFIFDVQPNYILTQCEQPNVFSRLTQWGLGWNMGFYQKTYDSTNLSYTNGDTSIVFNYLNITDPNYTFITIDNNINTNGYYLKSPCTLELQPDTVIYIEIEKFNYTDELLPYSCFTNSINTTASYNGIMNSAFVKVPLISRYLSPPEITNCGFCVPVIEKISKFKFKFRYHDGRLVNFKDSTFNFSLEINQIRNEISRGYNNVRRPN